MILYRSEMKLELVIIEMNECFVVEIFSEALGSGAVFFGEFFWWCIEAPSVLEMERIVCLFISLFPHSREFNYYTTLHYSPRYHPFTSEKGKKQKT